MNPSSETVSAEIQDLLDNLSDENYYFVVQELSQFIDNGTENSILLVEMCFNRFTIYREDLKSMFVEPAIAALFRKLMEKPHFVTIFSHVILTHTPISEEFIDDLSNSLQLSACEKIGLGLLLLDSENNDIKIAGRDFCMSRCVELCDTYDSLFTANYIVDPLRFLEKSEVLSKYVDTFMQMILQIWLNVNLSFMLAPDDPKYYSWIDFHVENLIDMDDETQAPLFAIMLGLWNKLSYRCGELRRDIIQLRADVAFSVLMSCYQNVYQEPFPLAVVCGNVWENTEAQLLFLKHAISAAPEVFAFAHSSRQLEYAEFQADHESQPWLCLDLLEVLCQLAEGGHATSVWSLLEFPLKSFPEMLLLAMAHVITPYNLLQYEVCATLLPRLLKDASMKGIIHHMWHVNSGLFSIALNDTLNLDLENMSRVVDLFHELEILLSVLDLVPMSLGIRLAALASRKEYIHLEEWLTTKLIAHEDSFIEECLKFLKEVEDNSCEIWNIYKDTASTFSKVLQLHTRLLSSDRLCEKMESLYVTCMDSNPKKENPRVPDGSSKLYEDHISEKATSYIQQMFCGQSTVGEMVNMLAQFQESFEKRDNMVFECIISSLCEDYKFFNQYPDEHLMMAADLFGLLIRYHLVSHYALDIFLKAVLEALHEPVGSKMFVFGTKALEHIVDHLIEWPEYSRKLLQISHICSTRSELVSVIEQTVARTSLRGSAEGQNPGTNQSDSSITPANIEIPVSSSSLTGSDDAHLDSQVLSPIDSQQNNKGHLDERHTDPNSSTSGQVSVATSSGLPQSMTSSSEKLRAVNTAGFGSAASIETLLAAAESNETSIETPPSDIQDKISLIINNLSAANTDTRAKECKEILDEQYYTWFAQYLGMKRASMEPNFHMMYIDFVEKINSKHLNKELVEASYQNCKVLLKSPLIKSSDKERKLLKNLGGWIGKITIGKNQVLRAKHVDPKSLIVEAYTKGLMIGVIPFTSKILESCKNSLAYQPPNPWTMAILGLLAEIHAMKNLKANLKFEIEILFKNLNVDMKEVTPSSLLKNRVRIVEGNPDFSSNSSGSYLKQKDKVTSNSTVRSVVNQVKSPVVAAGPSDQAGHTHMPPTAAGASYQSHVLHKNAVRLHPPTVMLGENEKKASLGSPNQLPPAQGPQVAQFPNVIPLRAPIIPDLELFRLNKFFRSVLSMAMKMALEEVISSFVKRSVSLATTTTIELILKDYSTELDDDYIMSASCRMVSRLAGELSYVTSKEPFREKLSTNLRNSLQGLNVANNLIEHAMQPVIDENLESGCDFIEKAAIDEGQTIVTREITEKLSVRKKHREAFHPRPGDFSFFQHQVIQDSAPLQWQNLYQHWNA